LIRIGWLPERLPMDLDWRRQAWGLEEKKGA
jgi:hypothetical protein